MAKKPLLYRSQTNSVLGGVAGGLGEYFDIDPTVIRIAFILLTVFGGSGILVYIILWLIIPLKGAGGVNESTVRKNAEEIQKKAEEFGENLKSTTGKDNSQSLLGIALLGLGLVFLLNNFGFFSIFDWGKLWPAVLVLLGFAILTKKG